MVISWTGVQVSRLLAGERKNSCTWTKFCMSGWLASMRQLLPWLMQCYAPQWFERSQSTVGSFLFLGPTGVVKRAQQGFGRSSV